MLRILGELVSRWDVISVLGIAYIVCITALLLKIDKNHWTTKTYLSRFLLPFLSASRVPHCTDEILRKETWRWLSHFHRSLLPETRAPSTAVQDSDVLVKYFGPQGIKGMQIVPDGHQSHCHHWRSKNPIAALCVKYKVVSLSQTSSEHGFPIVPSQYLGTQMVDDSQEAKGRVVEVELLLWTKLVIAMVEL